MHCCSNMKSQLGNRRMSVSSPSPQKDDLRITKSYIYITLTAKIYDELLLYCIRHKIENILWKNQNGFWRNRFTTSKILAIHRIIEGYVQKISMKHYGPLISPRDLILYAEQKVEQVAFVPNKLLTQL